MKCITVSLHGFIKGKPERHPKTSIRCVHAISINESGFLIEYGNSNQMFSIKDKDGLLSVKVIDYSKFLENCPNTGEIDPAIRTEKPITSGLPVEAIITRESGIKVLSGVKRIEFLEWRDGLTTFRVVYEAKCDCCGHVEERSYQSAIDRQEELLLINH